MRQVIKVKLVVVVASDSVVFHGHDWDLQCTIKYAVPRHELIGSVPFYGKKHVKTSFLMPILIEFASMCVIS